jgi:cobalt/nickel transport protein
MNRQCKNGLLVATVAALVVVPLILVKPPMAGSDGKQIELFKGSDDQASIAIQALAPDYKPWFKSIYTTPGPATDNLFFALQAALGAGFLGYYVGYSRGRAKNRSEAVVASDTPEERGTELVFCEKCAEHKS